jgi:acyl-CoA dehydrogenase
MPYRSPGADILFSLSAVADFPRLVEQGLMGDLDWDAVSSIVAEAGRFATDEIAPLNRIGDLAGARYENGVVTTPPGFADVYRHWAEGGWNGVSAPAEFGGMGLPHLVNVACTEIWNGASMAFALCPLLTEGAIGALKAHGSRELTDIYLPPMVSGRWTGTMNLTEPQAGSDLSAVRTRAERAADGSYRLFGQKIFITYGEHDMAENIVHFVLARLPAAPAGTRGLSLFLAPKFLVKADGSLGERNDLRCAGIEHKLGIHGSPTCVMVYGDNEGAKAWLVGDENRGLAAMFVMMNAARLAVGTQGVAIADRAFQQALAYARERRQGRSAKGGDGMAPIIERPDVQRMLMTMKANVHAARGICHLTGVSPPQTARRCSPPSPRRSRPTSATRRRRSASRSMGAWASSRRPERPSTCAIPASPQFTKARTASTRSTSCSASCRWPTAKPSATRLLKSGKWRATSPGAAAQVSARPQNGSPRLRTRSKTRRG